MQLNHDGPFLFSVFGFRPNFIFNGSNRNFHKTKHQHFKLIDGFTKNIIHQLTKTTIFLYKHRQRPRARFTIFFIENFYFLDWVVNKTGSKTIVTKFKADTKNLHINRNDKPFIGNILIKFFRHFFITIKENDRFSAKDIPTNKFAPHRLPIISIDDFKTFTVSNLTKDSSFFPDLLSKPKHFRELYPFRKNKSLLFTDTTPSISNAG